MPEFDSAALKQEQPGYMERIGANIVELINTTEAVLQSRAARVASIGVAALGVSSGVALEAPSAYAKNNAHNAAPMHKLPTPISLLKYAVNYDSSYVGAVMRDGIPQNGLYSHMSLAPHSYEVSEDCVKGNQREANTTGYEVFNLKEEYVVICNDTDDITSPERLPTGKSLIPATQRVNYVQPLTRDGDVAANAVGFKNIKYGNPESVKVNTSKATNTQTAIITYAESTVPYVKHLKTLELIEKNGHETYKYTTYHK